MKKRVIIAAVAFVIGVLLLAFSVWTENEAKQIEKAQEIAEAVKVRVIPEYAGKLTEVVEILANRELTAAEEQALLDEYVADAAKATQKAVTAAEKAAKAAEEAKAAAAAAVGTEDESAAAEKAAEAQKKADDKAAAVEKARAEESKPFEITDKDRKSTVEDRHESMIEDLLDVKFSKSEGKALVAFAEGIKGDELDGSGFWLSMYSMYFTFHGAGVACIVLCLALLLPGRTRIIAGVVAVAMGVALICGALMISHTVKDKSLGNLATLTKIDEVNRDNSRLLLKVLDVVLDKELTDEEKMARTAEYTGLEYSKVDQTKLLGSAAKQLPDGITAKLRVSLTLHPIDQMFNVDGLVLIVVGLAMVAIGDRRKKA